MPRKLLDSSRMLAMGWRPSTSLDAGLAQTYAWYLTHVRPYSPADVAATDR